MSKKTASKTADIYQQQGDIMRKVTENVLSFNKLCSEAAELGVQVELHSSNDIGSYHNTRDCTPAFRVKVSRK